MRFRAQDRRAAMKPDEYDWSLMFLGNDVRKMMRADRVSPTVNLLISNHTSVTRISYTGQQTIHKQQPIIEQS